MEWPGETTGFIIILFYCELHFFLNYITIAILYFPDLHCTNLHCTAIVVDFEDWSALN